MRAATLGRDNRERITLETNVKPIELRELWRRYKSEGDPRVRERLVVAYSPLVKYVAGRTAAGLRGGIRVGAEGAKPEGRADRAPGQIEIPPAHRDRLDVVERDDPEVRHSPAKTSPCRRERRRRTALVCSWETRDSVTPSTSPISRSVRFS